MPSRSTAELLTVVSDKITRAFNRSGATRAVALDISKASNRLWHAGRLHKLRFYGISDIWPFLSFLTNRRLRVVPDGKSLQEYQLTLEFFKARFLFQHFSYYTLMTFLMMLYVILSMLMILLSTLSLIRYLDLWQQLELASRLESNLWDTVDWGSKWLVDFSAGKAQLVSFDWSNSTCATDVKMSGSVLEEKVIFLDERDVFLF